MQKLRYIGKVISTPLGRVPQNPGLSIHSHDITLYELLSKLLKGGCIGDYIGEYNGG